MYIGFTRVVMAYAWVSVMTMLGFTLHCQTTSLVTSYSY